MKLAGLHLSASAVVLAAFTCASPLHADTVTVSAARHASRYQPLFSDPNFNSRNPVLVLSAENLPPTSSTKVPEPASLFLIGTGLISGATFFRRRFNRN